MAKARTRTPVATVVLLVLIGAVSPAGEPPVNLIPNGGFEDGTNGWSWGQWKGLPEPGFLDKEVPYKGKASYTMSLAGIEGQRSMVTSASIDPTKDYELSFALRGKGLPERSVAVALLQWGTEKGEKARPQGWVWLPGLRHAKDLLVLGGTFEWRETTIHLYRQGIKPTTKRLTLYIQHNAIGEGELSIDEVSLVAVEPVPYKRPAQPRAPAVLATRRPPPSKKPLTPEGDEPSAGESKDVLLSRCDSTLGWGLNLGKEFRGAKGELTTTQDGDRDVLEVAFDLSDGGRYVGAQRSASIRGADAIAFEVQSDGRAGFGARVRDATGQVHYAGFSAKKGVWTRVVLPLTKDAFQRHWGGAKDGKIHFPLRRILIAANSSTGAKGEFLLRNVAVQTHEPKRTWGITVTTDQPGHIHFIDEPRVTVAATIDNLLREKRSAAVAVEVVDADGDALAVEGEPVRLAQKLSLGPWAAGRAVLSLDAPELGYFHVRVSVGEGAAREQGEGAFGLVHRPLRYRQRDPDSFFAMHTADSDISARIGVHWYRYYHKWRWGEYHEGVYEQPSERLQACLNAGIDIMMCLNYQEPAWLKPRTGPDGLPTADAIRRFGDFVRASVRAHPFVTTFEIQNEPDLCLMAHRNLSLDKGVEFYSRLVKLVAPIVRKESPGIPIAGCNVSGQDQKAGYPFCRAVLSQVGSLFEVWAPHPYASPRTFGPGLAPLSPEDNRETEKHVDTLAVIREHGGKHRYWIGEKGWEIQDVAPLFGKISLSFADYCARSLIIAKSVPGVEKYFWFLQSQEFSRGAKYPLFRGRPLQPMPAAVAYANVAFHLDHARPIESLQLAGGGIRICVFERPSTNTVIAAAWSVKTPFVLEAALPEGARAFDLYGRRVPTTRLEVTETPLFTQAPAAKAGGLLSAMKEARFQPTEPFDVVTAHLADTRTVRIGLRNNTSQVVRVTAQAVGVSRATALLPNCEEASWLELSLPNACTDKRLWDGLSYSAGAASRVRGTRARLSRASEDRRLETPSHGGPARPRTGPAKLATTGPGRSLTVLLTPRVGKPVELNLPTNLLPVARKAGIVLDARMEDWRGIPAIVLNARDKVLPPDEAGWLGPDDLSVRISSAWDEKSLYLLVRVTDDTHFSTGRGHFWKQDALQIALDMRNDAATVPAFDANDREYGLLLRGGRAHTFRSHPRGATFEADFPAASTRLGSETVYEMALPWSDLGRKPAPGMVFSLNVVAIDNDGAGANYWMGLTPGIVEGKRPGLYWDFYLTE